MSHTHLRSALSSAIGTLDHVAATLSRAEHGTDRETVANARARLRALSAELLTVRAQLAPRAETAE